MAFFFLLLLDGVGNLFWDAFTKDRVHTCTFEYGGTISKCDRFHIDVESFMQAKRNQGLEAHWLTRTDQCLELYVWANTGCTGSVYLCITTKDQRVPVREPTSSFFSIPSLFKMWTIIALHNFRGFFLAVNYRRLFLNFILVGGEEIFLLTVCCPLVLIWSSSAHDIVFLFLKKCNKIRYTFCTSLEG